MNLLARLLPVVLSLLLVSRYVPGITVSGFYTALIVALVLGVLNLTVRPILLILTLPVNLITFGLFTFVLNAGLFWFVATFVEGFSVAGFIPAFIGAFAVSVVHWIGEKIF